ncbi:MAG: glutamine-hydrolyzing GMP synthase, partial [Patescibacteria group bacterium]
MIYIVDFGSQTTHLISRRISGMGIRVKIVDPKRLNIITKSEKPAGIILSGSPEFVNDKEAPTIDRRIFNSGIPILGICYGLQLTSHLLGGKVISGKIQEFGPAELEIVKKTPLFFKVPQKFEVWMSHGDKVVKIPTGFQVIAKTHDIDVASMSNETKKIYGIQFHPEVSHTKYGQRILENFVKLCNLKVKTNKVKTSTIVQLLKNQMPDGNAICGVSGGIDSTVAAILCAKAIGKRLFPVYIESGLMRIGTKEAVKNLFKKHVGIEVKIVNAKKEFLNKLKGVVDPEKKRKIIGKLYIQLFEKEAKKLKNVKYLVQ